jgi:phospholipid-binding lipoprotein MlaA
MRDRHASRVISLSMLLLLFAFAAGASAGGTVPLGEPPAEVAQETLPGVSAPPGSDPLFDDFDEDEDIDSPEQKADPFENGNRKVFKFNEAVDAVFFRPVLTGYRFIVPNPARKGIRRMFLNFASPKVFVNDLLQLRFRDAGITLGRLVLNTSLGVGGLLDAGEAAGWPRHESDFGQTLAMYGTPAGPYLVVPLFGPNTVRDGFGDLVDLAFQPLTYFLWPAQILLQLYIEGGKGLTALDANYDAMNALESSSIDFYAAMRSAYLQNRRAMLAQTRGEEPESEDLTVPDEEEGAGVDDPTAVLAQ